MLYMFSTAGLKQGFSVDSPVVLESESLAPSLQPLSNKKRPMGLPRAKKLVTGKSSETGLWVPFSNEMNFSKTGDEGMGW